uniref:Uncharacterized protein n=1 Tax=Denticeps clupeoides TaxID=299321 RepID=A0AAY4CMR6_9TELE
FLTIDSQVKRHHLDWCEEFIANMDLVDALKTEVRAVLESELASIKSDIRAVQSELKEYRETVTTELSGLSVKVNNVEESLSTCTDDITHLQKEVGRLTTLTEIIIGVPEAQICSTTFVSSLLQQAFELKEAPLLDRAHRSFLPGPRQGNPPHVIVARFHYYQDCENILRLAKEKHRIKINDMSISVFPDFTAKVAEARAAFNDIRRQLRGMEGVKFGILAKLRFVRLNIKGWHHPIKRCRIFSPSESPGP